MATKRSVIHNLAALEKSYKQRIISGNVEATPDLFDLYTRNNMHDEASKLAEASYQLALSYLPATHPNDEEKAVKLCEYASELGGHFEAMCFLFDYYAHIKLDKYDPKFKALLVQMDKLAAIYHHMPMTNPDLAFMHDRAIELYYRAWQLGNIDALHKSVRVYQTMATNNPGMELIYYKRIIELYELAVKRGDINAMYRLCEIYLEKRVPVEPQKHSDLANKLYESALFYQQTRDADHQEQILRLYEYACHLGHAAAIDYMAVHGLAQLSPMAIQPKAEIKSHVEESSVETNNNKENRPVNKPATILATTRIGHFTPVNSVRTVPNGTAKINPIKLAIFGY
jgi:TPR repeat protein